MAIDNDIRFSRGSGKDISGLNTFNPVNSPDTGGTEAAACHNGDEYHLSAPSNSANPVEMSNRSVRDSNRFADSSPVSNETRAHDLQTEAGMANLAADLFPVGVAQLKAVGSPMEKTGHILFDMMRQLIKNSRHH